MGRFSRLTRHIFFGGSATPTHSRLSLCHRLDLPCATMPRGETPLTGFGSVGNDYERSASASVASGRDTPTEVIQS
jgi:hypothetical protein